MATLNLNITGGSSPYTISVKKTGDNTERFQSFTSGVVNFTSDSGNNQYTITVSKSGCTQAVETFTLNCATPTPIPIPIPVNTCNLSISNVAVNCVSNNNGTITITASNPNALILQYQVTGFATWQTSNVFTNVPNGTYEVGVRNVNNTSCADYRTNIVVNCTAPTPIPIPVEIPTAPTPVPVNPTPIPLPQPIPVPTSTGCTSYDVTGGSAGSTYQFKYCGSTEVTTLNVSASSSVSNICVENSYGMNRTVGNGIIGNNGTCTESPTPIPLPVPIPIPIPVAPPTPIPIPLPVPVSLCVNLSVTNNELVSNIITFTLCTGVEQSYTLTAGATSPTVCALNADAWLSNLPNVTVNVGSSCSIS